MSKKKKSNNRLKDLFSVLEQDAAQTPTEQVAIPGWIWECDSDGAVTACSSEVESVLGISPQAFIGQPLSSYRLDAQAEAAISSALQSNCSPSEVIVNYQSEQGKLVMVRMTITKIEPDENIKIHWRGFNQVIEEQRESPGLLPATEILPALPRKQTISQSIPKTIGVVAEDDQVFTIPARSRLAERAESQAEPGESLPKLAVPIELPGQSLGLLEIADDNPNRKWTEEELQLVEEVADQLSLALENANLFQQMQRRSTQLLTASEVSKAASSILEPNPLIQQTVNLIQERFGLYYVGLFIVDESGSLTGDPGKWAVLRAGTGDAGRIQLERHHKLEIGGGSMIGECIRTGKAQTPSRITDASVRYSNPLLPETRTEIALPLISRGQTIGAMTIQSALENAFNDEDIAILQTMSDQVANALQNANLFDQTQARSAELAVLNEMSQALSASLDIQTIVKNIYKYTSRLVNASTFFVALYDQEKDIVTYPLAIEGNEEIQIEPRPSNLGLTGYLLETQKPLLLTEGIEELRRDSDGEVELRFEGVECQSWLGVPMMVGKQAIGVINVQDSSLRAFNDHHQDLMVAIASQSAIALQNAGLFTQTQNALSETEELVYRLGLLNELGEELSLVETTQDAYKIIVTKTQEIYYAESVSFTMLSPTKDSLIVEAIIGLTGDTKTGDTMPLHGSPMEAAIRENTIQVTQGPGLTGFGELKTLMVAPIPIGGFAAGTLNIGSVRPDEYSQRDRNLLLQVISIIGATLENRQLFSQVQEALAETEALLNITSVASSSLELETTLNQVLAKVLDTTGAASGLISVYNPRTQKLEIVSHHLPEPFLQKLQRDGLEGTLCDLVYQGKETISLDNLTIESPIDPTGLINLGFKAYQGIPLSSKGNVTGTLCIFYTHTFNTQEAETTLLEAVGNQIGVAIENANLYEQTQIQAAELAVLNEMSRVLSTLLDIDQIIPTIHQYTSRLMDTSYFFIALYNQRDDMISFPYVIEKGNASSIPPMKKQRGLTQHVIDTKEPLLIKENVNEVIKSLGLEHIVVGDPAKSWLGVPLILGQEVLGVIATQNADQTHVFNEHHQDLLVSIARQSAIAIQTARLFQSTRRQTEDLAVLNEMSRILTDVREIDQVLAYVHEYTSRLMDTNTFFIALYDEGTQNISMPLTIIDGEKISAPSRKLGEGLSDHVIRTGKPLLIEEKSDKKLGDLGIPLTHLAEMPETLSWLGAPMILGDRCIGVISVQNTTMPRLYNERHRDLLISIASQAAISLQNARLFAQTEQQLDDLTVIQATTSDLSENLSFEDVSNSLLRHVVEAVDANSTTLFLLKNDFMVRSAIYPASEGDSGLGEEIPLTNYPLTQTVIETRKPLSLSTDDPRLQPHAQDSFKKAGISANATIPVISPEGVMGIISMSRLKPAHPFNEQEINLVITLANQAAIALENARLYEEQLAAAEQLRELDKLKSQFLANMSHELRTPLNSIIGFSRVIMKGIDGPVTDLQQQDLSAIYNAGQHLLKMINDILDISKVDAGKMELAFEDVNITDVITSVLSTARGLVKDKPIKLVTATEDDLPLVSADSTRVRQVLLNLISNASKFTDEGSITVAARKQTDNNGKPEIYISVSDTGIGIAPEDQEKLFEPFTQVDGSPTRKSGGTGLGLSITRLLVELHGGEIGLHSEVGKGSTFYFTLPIDSGTPPPPDVEGSNTVLAIDDDLQVLQLYERYLSDSGFQVVSLTDPTRAMEYAREMQPAIITLDIMLPNYDGWSLLEELKNDPDTKDIPVVVCSILEDKDKGLSLGAEDYLMKPILAEDLVNVLQGIRHRIALTSEEVVP